MSKNKLVSVSNHRFITVISLSAAVIGAIIWLVFRVYKSNGRYRMKVREFIGFGTEEA